MGTKFKELREQLDSLGYKQKLVPECVPLVERILLDLNATTANLQKYMRISQQALEERDLLELGAEPYKCDNSKLIKECNDLHIAFIHFKEQHEKIQRELRLQISTLQVELENCNIGKNKLMSQIQQLEKERFRKGSKGLTINKEKSNVAIDKTMPQGGESINELSRKLKDLEGKHVRVMEDNELIKNQLKNRDEEINRLYALIEGGRSYNSASKDCCYKNIDNQMVLLQDEVTRLKREKNDLQSQIKDALAKQHEAMRRALHLAERNRQLEKEMKDVDEIALAVEAECNSAVKGNTEKVARLQDRINESLILIQNLEADNAKLKQSKLAVSAELDAIRLEKTHLQKQLEKEREDKKTITNRINSFTIIENDLNLEIDRLTKLNTEQKRRIAELESDVAADKSKTKGHVDYFEDMDKLQNGAAMSKPKHKKTCKKASKGKSPTKSRSPTKLESKTENIDSIQKCCCESGNCIKNLKELLDKEVEYRQVHAKQSMEDLRQEKDYYMKEYHRVLEQVKNASNYEISENGLMQLKQQLRAKENEIKRLEEEVRQLNVEKSARLVGEYQGFGTNKSCNQAVCKSRERELEIKTKELHHLEMDNNTLKAKLQAINESNIFNEERMKKAFKDMEEHIRKLEDERRDLVKTELTHRSSISQLEDDYRNVREQLKQTQNELNNQRSNYNQLKLLHEQTDRALADAQAKAIYVENEVAGYRAKVRDSSRDTVAQDKEIAKLLSDIQIMKNQLSKIDREKDDLMNDLDEKTEKAALLEDELCEKNKLISRLENELKELNRKLSKYATETSSQDQIVRTKQQELALLEQEYDKEKRLKEAALIENKRLQNDLASVSSDCRDCRNELEIARRQVEDLKRQLQHYVAEVKRTEDLISQKELERNELLDQFRSLSQEANVLENNNHTLETEATQSKIQLSVALDHTSELERKVEHQESVIRSYEKQIGDLTAHIARLEVQLRQNAMEQEQYAIEMKQMRDLCVKLDKDKDDLKQNLYSKEDRQLQVQKVSDKLNAEREALQKALGEERSRLDSVEKLLGDARREVTEQRLLNQDMQREVNSLKQKIRELEESLFFFERKAPQQNVDLVEPPKETFHFDDYLGSSNILSPPKKNLSPIILNRERTNEMSLLSTKTLTMTNKFHGSDGIAHGAIDLTKLNEEECNNCSDADCIMSANKNYSNLKDYSEIYNPSAVQSTRTLVSVNGMICNGCDEHCRRAQHKCSNPNFQQESRDCRYCKKMPTNNECMTKSVEFSRKPLLDPLINEKSNAQTKPRHTHRNTEQSNKSVCSTRTITADDDQPLRLLNKGRFDLQDTNKINSNEPNHNKRIGEARKTGKCSKCYPKTSTSEPNITEKVLSKELLLPTQCKHKISTKSSEVDFKAVPEKLKPEATNDNYKSNPCSYFAKDRKADQQAKNNEVHSKFHQNCEDSATFHKVFSVDGVGLECHCCISSFKLAEEK